MSVRSNRMNCVWLGLLLVQFCTVYSDDCITYNWCHWKLLVVILLENVYQYRVLIIIYQAPAQNVYHPIKDCFYSVVKYSQRNNFKLLDRIRWFWWQGDSMSELMKAILGANHWKPFPGHLEPVSPTRTHYAPGMALPPKTSFFSCSFQRKPQLTTQ